MKIHRIFQLTIILAVISTCFQIAVAQNAPLSGFDDYVNKAMRDWDVPGVAIAIVKDDKVVFAKGYGVKKLGDSAPVDERTLFAIGSSSKAFTAAALAMLVDEGKVKWNDPVTKYLPDFEMYDPYVTREMTIRDLLCHRSGLERGDFLWYGTDTDRDEIIRHIRFIKPSWSFRSNFGYQNLMFLTAGQVVSKVAGKSWDAFIAERIFKPLGMTSSDTSITAFKPGDNISTPHAMFDDKAEPIAWRKIDNIAPAGSINSNVTEMAQWIRLQLGQGTYQGKRIFSSGAAKEMHSPQTIIPLSGNMEMLYPDAHFLSYGLGWFLSDYHGRKLVEHGGAIDGMRAEVALIPEEKLGVVVLTNMNGTILPHLLMYRAVDAYLGLSNPKDWSADVLKTYNALLEQGKAAAKKQEESRVLNTKPSLALDKYAGTYKNDLYGEVKVTDNGGKLNVRFGPPFVSDLEHWHYDTFRATYRGAGESKSFVTFTLNSQGKVDQVTLDLAPDYPFKRMPDEVKATGAAMTEAEMKTFAGVYESKAPPVELSFEIIGGKLKAIVPGQPNYTLVPVAANRFALEGLPDGFFVQFEKAGGRVTSVTFIQGAGPSITLKPKQ